MTQENTIRKEKINEREELGVKAWEYGGRSPDGTARSYLWITMAAPEKVSQKK
jgi:DNA-binding transcriptional regulator YiaG